MDSKVFNIGLVSSSDHRLVYKAEVIEGHSIFKGHFPQSPVVPGVCTMGMVKECLEDALSRPVRYNYITECKFLSAIIPTKHKELEVTLVLKSITEQGIDIVAEVVSAGVSMMKLKATLAQR